jgi:uncharacterized membrane protein YfcA
MSFTFPTEILYSISGFGVGVLVGMTGVGGGSLMTPLLIVLFGIHPAAAVGTDLLYAAVTKAGGSVIHGLARTIDWHVAALLSAGSVPVTIATLVGLSHFGLSGARAAHLISTMLGVTLMLTAVALIFRKNLIAFYAARIGDLSPRRTQILTVLVGGALGFLVSISSVGAGAIGVTALVLLYPRLPTARIVGTDIAHAVPLTLVAGTGYWILGSIDWSLLGSLLVGSLPGIFVGSYFSGRIPERALQLVLASTLTLVASRLLL